MATTPRQILQWAYSRNKKFQPRQIAAEETELFDLVNQSVGGLFAFAARLNPMYFGTKLATAYATDSWPRPSDAELVWRAEDNSDSSLIQFVDIDDREAVGSTAPALYRLGQKYYTAVTNPTNTVTVDFLYSRQPVVPTDLDDDIDPDWPEQFNPLLSLEVAIYLAIKDRMADVRELLQPERDRQALRFAAFLEHETINVTRRWAHFRLTHTETIVPTRMLLAGGSAIDFAQLAAL